MHSKNTTNNSLNCWHCNKPAEWFAVNNASDIPLDLCSMHSLWARNSQMYTVFGTPEERDEYLIEKAL